MRLANLEGRAILVDGDKCVDVAEIASGRLPSDPMLVLERLDDLREYEVPVDAPPFDEQRLGPPVPRPSKILGAGINYFDHAEEANFDIPDQPIFFSKLPSAICGPTSSIRIPIDRSEVDWEAEVVVVIGSRTHRIEPSAAWSHVAGITGGQDISDRPEQFRSLGQFTMAKSFDTYAPIGPTLITVDELRDKDDIGLSCWLDGESVQEGSTASCIFGIPELIAWASHVCTLNPGDLIFTGTPPGVGYIRKPPRFLHPGAVLETAIEGVGRMRNVCAAGPPAYKVER